MPIAFYVQAIDKDSDGALTLEEFIDAYNRRTEILKRQVWLAFLWNVITQISIDYNLWLK